MLMLSCFAGEGHSIVPRDVFGRERSANTHLQDQEARTAQKILASHR